MIQEVLFTFILQVKQAKLRTILDSGSQKNLIVSTIVQELGLELKDHPNPYELSGRNQESYDKVIKKCTFKYAITKDFMDEMTYDMVPMDCTNVLVSILFLRDIKTHIILIYLLSVGGFVKVQQKRLDQTPRG